MGLLDSISISQAALGALVLYLAWQVVRPFVVKTALDNIDGPPSESFVFGNIPNLMSRHCFKLREELARQYGRVILLHGLLGAKWVVTYDPKALHAVFIKEQDIYEEPVASLRLLLGPGLLGTLGEQHRKQRKMLNPVFSTKHLRDMTPLFYDIVHKTRDAIMTRVRAGAQEKDSGVELDMLSWMGRTTLEVLGQAGLGYSFDPLVKDVPDDFATAIKDFFPQMARSIVLRLLLPVAVKIGPPQFRRRVVDMIPADQVQRMKDISDILHARSVLIFNEKKTALAQGDEAIKHQIGEGRDIMSILLRANMLASDEDKLGDDELIGQISTMILAGMDTTANTLARILHLLAQHPEVQERARAEIIQAVEAEGNGDMLDFDRLMELPYLDAICRETLRTYVSTSLCTLASRRSSGITVLSHALLRNTSTVKDTVLPFSKPIRGKDGTLLSAIPIPKGTRIVADVYACNRNPELWGPDADKWRPERWLEGVPKAVEDARVPGVYSHLMTFIGGSRACIGFKFAQVEMSEPLSAFRLPSIVWCLTARLRLVRTESVLCILLQWFKFELTDKPITWNFAAVQYPTVGKDSTNPELPLKVSLLRP
ncbi:hypothetical protein BN946_scf184942.g29 [Trametes cinnabarina]|uniref:Cytochrome P450 n=1 Tax=Pycnoporus cinnabarinus TaxID=5643 RepID=A0A060SD66_PYCCI|nr:hypothetical protein BN946_scf184942.g29 [Trametes cinnabarina]